MRDRDHLMLESVYDRVILSESVLPRPITDFSPEEKQEILSKLSDIERTQLGTPYGGTSKKTYMSPDDWIVIRDLVLRKALARNPETNPNLCAYTPGETIKLLNNPIIKNWFSMVEKFKVPEGKEKVIFVSCAASKRWGNTTKAKDYKCYNILRTQNDKNYWVTISEPLGIVPEDHWDDFPFYDNPGLFNDAYLSNKDWEKVMRKPPIYRYPFDHKLKDECIRILGNVIKKFYEFNKSNNPNLKFISAVESISQKSTHSEMLDVAGILQQEQRHSRPHAKTSTKEDRMAHWTNISNI
jgi:hypothetical protein